MEKDFRAEIGALVENRKQAYTDMSDRIWGFAEPRFQEYDSSRLQQEYLKARGFSHPGGSGRRGDGVYCRVRHRKAGTGIFGRV